MNASSSNDAMTPSDPNADEGVPGAEHHSASIVAVQRAAAILDVLAGQRTTAEAAAALKISVNHYYLLERRALQGLTAACEPLAKRPKGPSMENQLQALQRELEQCQRESLRQAALVRATQRTVGLASVPEPKKGKRKQAKGGATRKKRRPTVRALRAAQTLRKNSSRPKTEIGIESESTREPATRSNPSSSHSPKERHDGDGG